MRLNRYQRLAYRIFGEGLRETAQSNQRLKTSLQQAQIYMRPEVYLSYGYMNMLVAFVSSFVLVLVFWGVHLAGVVRLPPALLAFLIPVPLFLSAIVYLITYLVPDLRANARSADIDARIPYALNFIATMSNAGVTPAEIFESLSRQPIYGEVANEAAWISRDLRLLGKDTVTALKDAIGRSPSVRWQDLLQGAIASITTGGDLTSYFLAKSDQYIQENRRDQVQFLESLGVIAESFVTVVVAAPLFFIVLLVVMTTFGSGGPQGFTIGYVLILVLLPLSQFGFAMAIKSMTPEV